jgi:hypothetical protein
MAETISEIISGAIKFIREIVAIWHYVSDIMALIEILQLISAHGAVDGLIIWLASSIVSGFLAELLESLLPTPLRPILRKLGII